MKLCRTAVALLLVVGLAARAEDAPAAKVETPKTASTSSSGTQATVHVSSGGRGTGYWLVDLFANLAWFGLHAAVLHDRLERVPGSPVEDGSGIKVERRDEPTPWSLRRVRQHDARQGLLFSFGLGGGSLRVSPQHGTGALNLDFRLGYGFSDRFQFFADISVDGANYGDGSEVASWTATARGQTVLLGDRDGNGLNLNAGLGLGGITRRYAPYDQYDSPAGLALAGGLSYDARLGRNFAFSPELFFTWHQVPNGLDAAGQPLPKDIATTAGLRLNFLWYLY